MQIRVLVTFVIVATIIAAPLLAVTNTINNSNNNNDNNNQLLQQAFATHMDTATSNETTILHQGIIASEKATQIKTSPNETIQVVTILPFRTDGSQWNYKK